MVMNDISGSLIDELDWEAREGIRCDVLSFNPNTDMKFCYAIRLLLEQIRQD